MLFTNHGQQTLLDKSKGVMASNSDVRAFDAPVG